MCLFSSFLMTVAVSYVLFGPPCCEGYIKGAPKGVCDHMTPKHRNETNNTGTAAPAQTSSSPYKVIATPGNGGVQIVIESDKEPFMGYLLQGFTESGDMAMGDYRLDDPNGKVMTCKTGNIAITQTEKNLKKVLKASWTAPAGFKGKVMYIATIVQSYKVFWVNISSPLVTPSEGGAGTPAESPAAKKLYSDCESSRGCFGDPDGCVAKKNCAMFVSYAPKKDTVHFQISAALPAGKDQGYVAMAFSSDRKMGDDMVTECVLRAGQPLKVEQSWNTGRSNDPIKSVGLKKASAKVENGLMVCEWELKDKFEAKKRKWKLKGAKYHLLLAIGDLGSDGKKRKHSHDASSPKPLDFSVTSGGTTKKEADDKKASGTPLPQLRSQTAGLVIWMYLTIRWILIL